MSDWVKVSGGKFDIIIDDGSHKNMDIVNSFDVLFHNALNPGTGTYKYCSIRLLGNPKFLAGGIYFVEDFQTFRLDVKTGEFESFTDYIHAWNDQLLTPLENTRNKNLAAKKAEMHQRHPIPKGVKWIFCQYGACAIGKCESSDCRASPAFAVNAH